MKKRTRKLYWLSWLLVLTLATVYVVVRKIPQRYAAHRAEEQQMEMYQQEASKHQQGLEQAEERVEGLINDPVEHEAAVRYAQPDKVRPGETIYKLKPVSPSDDIEAQ